MFGVNIDTSTTSTTRTITVASSTPFLDTIGNILWLFFGGGFIISLIYSLIGLIFCCTIILYPFGQQLFKLAAFALFPFGKTVTGPYTPCIYPNYRSVSKTIVVHQQAQLNQNAEALQATYYTDIETETRRPHEERWEKLYLLGNILWFPVGISLFFLHLSMALSSVFSIVGIPFAFQHFKLAQFAIFPFGAYEDNGLTLSEYLTIPVAVEVNSRDYIPVQVTTIPVAEPINSPENRQNYQSYQQQEPSEPQKGEGKNVSHI